MIFHVFNTLQYFKVSFTNSILCKTFDMFYVVNQFIFLVHFRAFLIYLILYQDCSLLFATLCLSGYTEFIWHNKWKHASADPQSARKWF